MKKCIILFAASLVCSGIYAQKWKEKLNAAKESVSTSLNAGAGENKDYSGEFEGKEFPDMMTFVDQWDKKSARLYNWSYKDNRYYAKDSYTVEVGENSGEYEYIMVDGKKYVPIKNPDSDKILKFKWSSVTLYLTDTKLVTYGQNANGEVNIRQVLGEKEPAAKLRAEIEAYLAYTESLINEDVAEADAERAKIAAEKEAARRKEFGLADKDVKSIEIVPNIPEVFGHFIPYSYKVVATLKDGNKITTGYDEGYYDDYIIEVPESDMIGALGSGFINSDELVITAKLKKNPSISTTKKIAIPYNTGATFQLYGKGWSGSPGEDGYDATVKIKQEKHAVTGKPVLRVQITSNASYAKLREFTIAPDKNIVIDCSGGSGGSDDGRHYNGGDGGNIRVIKDPSVESFYIDYDVSGGRAGGRAASDGRDGRYIVDVQPVTF